MGTTNVVLQGNGPLPLSGSFQVPSTDPVTFVMSATAWTSAANSMIGVQLLIDGNPIGTASLFANEASSHKTLVAPMLQMQFNDFNQHQITLAAMPGTVTDQNDFYSVAMIF